MPEQIEYPADIGMRDYSGQTNFALESLHHMGLREDILPDGFYRDLLLQFLVFGFVHFTNTASGNESGYSKPSGENLAGLKDFCAKRRRQPACMDWRMGKKAASLFIRAEKLFYQSTDIFIRAGAHQER
jgi:hypothetical protein